MRFYKNISITVITFFIILTITYSARVFVINSLAKAQLNLAQIKVTCLDISLDSKMAIIINKLCLQSPKTDIEIVDMLIQWQYSPTIKITNIDVRLANIKGIEHFFSNTNNTSSNNKHSKISQNFSQLLSTTLRPYIDTINQFNLPININIADISYLPFTVINEPKSNKSKNNKSESNKPETSKKIASQQRETIYKGKLSAIDNSLYFSLQNAERIEFVKAKLIQEKEGFSIALSSKLNLLKSFASAHQLPITTELQSTLNANEISGSVDVLIKYQADSISMHNQMTDLSIDFKNTIDKIPAFKLTGALNFKNQFTLLSKENIYNVKTEIADKNNTKVALTFIGKNELLLEYCQPLLFSMLEASELSPAIISILKDNPLTHLTLKSQGNGTLTLNDKKGFLSHIEISARGDHRIHQIKLDNIDFSFPQHSIILIDNDLDYSKSDTDHKVQKSDGSFINSPHSIVVESFIIDSQLNVISMTKLTNAPVVIHLEGSLKKTENKTALNLTENSSITMNNIVVLKQNNNATKSNAIMVSAAEKTTKLLSLKILTTTLKGTVQQLENNALSINLQVHNQASQVNAPKTLKINSFDLFSEIKGSLDDIRINATTSADGVHLGNIVITGPLQSPNIQIEANNLQLTDLLSLNIQLPTKIELVDGTLNYKLSGQLADVNNIENTPFSASFAIASVSGEIDGIWFQALNWQQNVTLFEGKITALANVTENLTVALIETPTPLSKLSLSTNWTFNKNFKLSASQLKADVLGGSFSVPKIEWPLQQGHSANVQLNSIDLEQVLALDKKQGIIVTGKISGQLPITFDGEKYIIENGELYNITDGLIQVMDNPAVAELKSNNTQLQLAFDALQNLHYHQLSSAVSMADDGYMLLETVIKGHNPDIDNDVNLNLNLSYDLLGLLESMSITQRFEESIIKGLQKDKE